MAQALTQAIERLAGAIEAHTALLVRAQSLQAPRPRAARRLPARKVIEENGEPTITYEQVKAAVLAFAQARGHAAAVEALAQFRDSSGDAVRNAQAIQPTEWARALEVFRP